MGGEKEENETKGDVANRDRGRRKRAVLFGIVCLLLLFFLPLKQKENHTICLRCGDTRVENDDSLSRVAAEEKKKRQSISGIDLSSVCSTEIPTSLSKLPPHLHIHNINLK